MPVCVCVCVVNRGDWRSKRYSLSAERLGGYD